MKLLQVLAIIVAASFSSAAEGQDWSAMDDFDDAKLPGRWKVVSVDVDGDFTKAQIG